MAQHPALAWIHETPFFQAGLQGYSDAAMRIVARRHGAPYCVTESLLDDILLRGGKGLSAQELDAEDHPIAGQIIGTNPVTMARAARSLLDLGYDVIDVNLACPVKKMRDVCRGGHLLTRPMQAIEILKAVRDSVAGAAPITVKLRRGYDDSVESLRNFHLVFEAVRLLGYASATVHCRTVEQKYEGPSRWPFLSELTRSHPGFCVLGSGDVFQAADVFRMIAETGVAGVSVARGAIGNPWIFSQARRIQEGREPLPPTVPEQRSALVAQYELCVRFHGGDAAGRWMRKVGIKMSPHHPRHREVEQAFIACRNDADWLSVIERNYSDAEVEDTSLRNAGSRNAHPGNAH